MIPNQAITAGNGKLDVLHVRQLIRLLEEAREILAAYPEREQHLVMGVARIVGAALAGSVLEGESMRADFKHSAKAFAPLVHAIMRITPAQPGATITVTWNELVAHRRHDLIDTLQPGGPTGTCEAIFSSVRLWMPSGVHGLALYRDPEGPEFSDDECNLVRVFHAACGSLLQISARRGEDAADCGGLSPRQRQTLGLVLRGLSDKEIADGLGISRYTVNQYTKAIYRHYSVSSRSQLLARLLTPTRSAHPLIVGS